MVAHLLEYIVHVGEAKLAGAILFQRMKPAGCDLIPVELVLLGVEGVHVVYACASQASESRLPL